VSSFHLLADLLLGYWQKSVPYGSGPKFQLSEQKEKADFAYIFDHIFCN